MGRGEFDGRTREEFEASERLHISKVLSDPSKGIAAAKAGSIEYLDAIVGVMDRIPKSQQSTNELLDLFLTHLSQGALNRITVPFCVPDDITWGMLFAIRSLDGLRFLFYYRADEFSIPAIQVNWSNLMAWMQFLKRREMQRLYCPDPKFDEGELAGAESILYTLAMRSKDAKFKRSIEEIAPALLASLWLREDFNSPVGPLVTNSLAYCLDYTDDRRSFWKRFVAEVGRKDKDIIEIILDRGHTLLKAKSPKMYFVGFVVFLIDSFYGIDPLPIWEVGLHNGTIAFVMKVFRTIAQLSEEKLRGGITEEHKALDRCLIFFRVVLLTNAGYPYLIQMLRKGFLEAFIRCSPAFPVLGDTACTMSKDTILRCIPAFLAYHSVLKYTGNALEGLDLTMKRRRIQMSTIDKEWNAFETLAFQRLICKRFYEVQYGKDRGERICNFCETSGDPALFKKCAACKITFYCSKECQAKDWKEQDHRGRCQTLALQNEETDGVILDDHVLLRNQKFALLLALREVKRHWTSLQKLVKERFPKVPRSRIGYSVDLTQVRPKIDVFDTRDAKGGSTIAGRRIDEYFAKSIERVMRTQKPGVESACLLSQIAEGKRAINAIMLMRIAERVIPIPRGADGPRRQSATDLNGLGFGAQWDELDDIMHFLDKTHGLRQMDDWYASGKGSLAKLNTNVEEIVKRRNLMDHVLEWKASG